MNNEKEINDSLHRIMDTLEKYVPGFPRMDRTGKISDIHILERAVERVMLIAQQTPRPN